ncbi:hypothetical protein DESPIG_00530 [Desulfovibrio piger ATCC 29098]|uniref:Uncharacterized protein n=1 Tax=Desulfovibrio piger ATCC 29098 TaxID=411464 RepID=B6WR49_9BACT|nr:hypothetical protein DESPIG_00530 [Desulfovibrio piger ATCC 29098]
MPDAWQPAASWPAGKSWMAVCLLLIGGPRQEGARQEGARSGMLRQAEEN